jgi:hypothetical protein
MLANKLLGAAKAATAAANYVDDVFSTYLYTGNGTSQYINNGIELASGAANGTSLQLTGDTLTDSSPVPSTLTVEGNTSVNTSVKKYGTGSIYFDGSGDRIVVPTATKLDLIGDFTIEMWVYPSRITSYQVLFDTSAAGSAGANMTEFWINNSGYVEYYARGSILLTGATVLSTNTWYHIALTKQGSTQRLFINGTLDASTTSATQPNTGYSWYIGDRQSGAGSGQYPLQGYIDDLRITNGTARYTSNFTAPTAALPLDTLVAGKGGMVWLKGRSGATDHALYDTARGATFDLVSNSTAAQTTQSTGLTAFNSNGFSLGALAKLNTNAATYVSWTFREQAKFFDVVTYTGNGTAGRTVAHNLGSVPGCMIVKRTDLTSDWYVYHRSLGNTVDLALNTTAAQNTATTWNNTTPTSTEFTLSGSRANINGATYVAYLFAHDAGGFGAAGTDNVISCGSYTGNGSATGPTITLGYEPQWVMIKRTDSISNWTMVDNMRGMVVGGTDAALYANLSNAESAVEILSPTATGFQITAAGGGINVSGGTYIYIAIRRPMKTPTSGTQVFTPIKTGSGSTLSDSYSSIGFPIDMTLRYQTGTDTTAGYKNAVYTRLLGINSGTADTPTSANNPNLLTHSTAAEVTTWYFSQTGSMGLNYGGSWSAPAYILTHLHFRRAPGFFDVVCYTGNGTAGRTVTHNLGVVPELIIIKNRSGANDWTVYSSAVGATKRLQLNDTSAAFTQTSAWNDTAPSSTVFTVGTSGGVNGNTSNYVAYLFATVAGVSKVGSYTGTGTTQTINCGFTAGARFVMIKRTDSTGDWYVWDTARGIVSGNDPYLLMNSTAAEVTNTDYIDPANSGFEISSTAPAAINANGGSFIFFAVA